MIKCNLFKLPSQILRLPKNNVLLQNSIRSKTYKMTKEKLLLRYATEISKRNVLKGLPLTELCEKSVLAQKKEEPKKIHPYDVILAEELVQEFDNATFLAFFHMTDVEDRHMYNMRLLLNEVNMTIMDFDKELLEIAVANSKYKAMKKLYESKTTTFKCVEEPNFKKILSVCKKLPYMTLMGGFYHGKYRNVNELQEISKLTDIDIVHSQLSALLSAPGQRLSSNLTSHQTAVYQTLQRYMNENGDSK